ncbi:MAG: phosphoribosylformylglycinamidine synthase subunit PurQ [Balneolaceae bacterium]
MRPKIAIIEFPGTNCEVETAKAVVEANMEAVSFRYNEKPSLLKQYDGFILPGGASYEDRSRCGIIAALQPIIKYLKEEDKKGKPILGICNGAQILIEAAMVPGFDNYTLGGSLAVNTLLEDPKSIGVGLYSTSVNIRAKNLMHKGAFFNNLDDNTIIKVPVAASSGRFVFSDEVLQKLKYYNCTALYYCNEQGQIINNSAVNPYNSINNIGALTNFNGNVLAALPHLERVKEIKLFLDSMHTYIIENKKITNQIVELDVLPSNQLKYEKKLNTKELVVGTIINDNSAATVQQTVEKLGFPVKIGRAIHWTLVKDENATEEDFINEVEKIEQSGHLFNPNKEFLIQNSFSKGQKILVQTIKEKDDAIALFTYRQLKKRFDLKSVSSIRHSILWSIDLKGDPQKNIIKQILKTNIFNNPFTHVRYHYE